MTEYIGNGSNNTDKGNLRMVSLITPPGSKLFDINYYEEEGIIVKKSFEINKPDFLTMRTMTIKSSGFILLKNELEIYKNTVDMFSCLGDYFFITLLQKGNAKIEDYQNKHYKKSKHPLQQNYLYFKSDIDYQHSIHMEKGEKIQYIALLLDKSFVKSLLKENYKELLTCELYTSNSNESPSRISVSLPLELNLYEAIKSLFEISCEEQIHLQFTKLKIIEILLLLNLNYNKKINNHSITQYDIEQFKKIKSWIIANYNKEFTLKSLSRLFGVNELLLKTGFKKLFGQTIRQFVIELRMDEAKKLIISNKETVNEIAFKIGYKSVSHFIQTFKKHYGVTPNQNKILNNL